MEPKTISKAKAVNALESDYVKAEVWVIEPWLAEYLLDEDKNEHNRSINSANLRLLTRRMKNGEWKLTGEPIILSSEGTLLNGQHRLNACINADKPFESLVVSGIPAENFQFLDAGKSRDAADVFHIEGVDRAAETARAVAWAWRIEKNPLTNRSAPKGPEALAEYRDRYVGIENHLEVGAELAKMLSHPVTAYAGGVSKAMMAALYWTFENRAGEAKAQNFADLILRGHKSVKPLISKLHEQQENSRKNGGRGIKDSFAVHLIAYAWGEWVRGRMITEADLQREFMSCVSQKAGGGPRLS